MEHVKLKHFARPDEANGDDWSQALEVSAKYLAKKMQFMQDGGAFDASNFSGIPSPEHFAFQAFDKLYSKTIFFRLTVRYFFICSLKKECNLYTP